MVAIGSPQGLTGTVTNGIISAFNRTVAVQGEDGSAVVYNGMQTDAPINPGNSGGPLVNLDGQVVGINSAIATSSGTQGQGGSIGLGFAIPIDQATRVAQEIMQNGTATKPVLGVTGNVSPQPAAPRAAQARRSARSRRARPRSRPGWPRATSSRRSATRRSRTSPTSSPASAPTRRARRWRSPCRAAAPRRPCRSRWAPSPTRRPPPTAAARARTRSAARASRLGTQRHLALGDLCAERRPLPRAGRLRQLQDRRVGLAAALAHRLQAVADPVVAHVVHQRVISTAARSRRAGGRARSPRRSG